MNSILSNLLILVTTNQIGSRLDFTNPSVLLIVRVVFAVFNFSTYLLIKHVKTKINASSDNGSFRYTVKNTKNTDGRLLFKTKPNKEYDLEQADAEIRSLCSSVAVVMFLHTTMNYNMPLVMQCVFPLKQVLESAVVQVNLFGKEASGKLQRPYGSYQQMRQGFQTRVLKREVETKP
ncbi:hypothetical protein ACO0QE_003284 [Hanseniaspora vineae]